MVGADRRIGVVGPAKAGQVFVQIAQQVQLTNESIAIRHGRVCALRHSHSAGRRRSEQSP